MGRRKKEPESVHRANIASAAEQLFSRTGTDAATMDEIAREAGYSKATLYVYFRDKREIVGCLVLKSMHLLYDRISEALSGQSTAKTGYDALCRALTGYQEQSPLYFGYALSEIDVDLESPDCLPVDRETYAVGEQINERLAQYLRSGMESGELRRDLPVLPTVFTFWASLSGLIRTAEKKRAYLARGMGLSKQQFLDCGFQMLYRAIAAEEGI